MSSAASTAVDRRRRVRDAVDERSDAWSRRWFWPSFATPATLFLQKAGVDFDVHKFQHDGSDRNFGAIAAAAIGADPDRVFKTLLASVDQLPPANIAVGIVPVLIDPTQRRVVAPNAFELGRIERIDDRAQRCGRDRHEAGEPHRTKHPRQLRSGR